MYSEKKSSEQSAAGAVTVATTATSTCVAPAAVNTTSPVGSPDAAVTVFGTRAYTVAPLTLPDVGSIVNGPAL